MIRELTGIRGARHNPTLWTAQGESVVVQADAEPGEVAGLRIEWIDCLGAYRLKRSGNSGRVPREHGLLTDPQP